MPDTLYVNLYHWLLGDTEHVKGGFVQALPIKGRQYYSSAEVA